MRKLHSDREYEADLQKVREDLLLMGGRVEEMVASSMQALVRRDTRLAEKTMLIDRTVNRIEMEIDEHCLVILARRQPVASDLRFITTALKLVTDLERMGDLGVNICERVIELNEEEPLKPYVDLVNMAEVAQGMLRDGLDALVSGDIDRAHAVIERDGEVDAYYKSIFRELLTYMMENPRNIYRATRVQSIAKYLERLADHATNVAELVVFMVRGKDIRHAETLGKVGQGEFASARDLKDAASPESSKKR
jgi:phosphate transport system protein